MSRARVAIIAALVVFVGGWTLSHPLPAQQADEQTCCENEDFDSVCCGKRCIVLVHGCAACNGSQFYCYFWDIIN